MNCLLILASGFISPVQRYQKHVYQQDSSGPIYCLYSLTQRPELQEFSIVDDISESECTFIDVSTFTQISALENVNLSIELEISVDANVSMLQQNHGKPLELHNCNFSFVVTGSKQGNLSGVAVIQKSDLIIEQCDFRFQLQIEQMSFEGISRFAEAGKIQIFESSWHGSVLCWDAVGMIYEEKGTLIEASGNVIKISFSRKQLGNSVIQVCAVAYYDDAIDYSIDNLLLCTGDEQRLNESSNGVCFNDIQSEDVYESCEEAYKQHNTTANTQYITPNDQGLFCQKCSEFHSGPKCQDCTDPGMRYLDGKCRIIVNSPLYQSDNCYYSREHQIYICQSCREGYALYDCSKCIDTYVKFEVCEPRCVDCYGECSQANELIKCKSCIQGFSLESFCKDCIENYSKINGICVPNVVCNVSDMVKPVHDIHSQQTLVVFTGNINCSIINIEDLHITSQQLNPNSTIVSSYRISIIESDMSAEVYEGKIINGSIDITAGFTSDYSFFGGIFSSQTLDKTITVSHISVNLSVTLKGDKWCVSPLISDVSFQNSRYNIINIKINSSSFAFDGAELIFGGLLGRYARRPYVDYIVNITDVVGMFSLQTNAKTTYGSLVGLLYNASLSVLRCEIADSVELGRESNFSTLLGEVGHENLTTAVVSIKSVKVTSNADLDGVVAAGGMSAFAHEKSGFINSIIFNIYNSNISGIIKGNQSRRFAQLFAQTSNFEAALANCSVDLEASGFQAAYGLFYGESSSVRADGCFVHAERCLCGGSGSFVLDGVTTVVDGECIV